MKEYTIMIERKKSREEMEDIKEKFIRMAHAGFTSQEIAKALELDESTVRSALIRLNELEFE